MAHRLDGLLSLLVLILALNCCNGICSWSNRTLRFVSSCPTTKKDLEKASKIMNCEALAPLQHCSAPSNFKYHCVISDKVKAFVEVCSPLQFSNGFCFEYHLEEGRIRSLNNKDCTTGDQSCPMEYVSTDMFLHSECYDLRNKTSDQFTKIEDSSVWLYGVCGSAVSIVVIITIIIVVIWRFRRRKMEDPHPFEEEHMLGVIEKNYESDDLASTISTVSVSDLFASIRGGLLQEISREKETDADIQALSEDNEQLTRGFLRGLQCFDKYFVETNFCRKATETLQTEGVAVLTGKPGNGKTCTAVHIMLNPYYKNWVKQKITTWSDFSFIDAAKDTLVFIDNIYDGNMYSHELDKWWDTFSNVVIETRKKLKGKVHILITAKENVIDKACEYMRRRTSVFREKFIIRTENFELSSVEKEAILMKQIEYAKSEKGFDPPNIDPEFIRELKTLNSVVGFPLCAHLYACVKDYRDTGIHFFREPVEYIRRQIKYEIDVDRTDKVKSLFLIMFLHQIYVDNGSQELCETFSLKSSKECNRYLEECFPNLINELELKSSAFINLLTVAKEMSKLNLISPIGEETYVFKHQTISLAVGHYFFTEYFNVAVKLFPIEAFEHEDFACREEKDYDNLANRLYTEVLKGNHSRVFSCEVFKKRVFSEHFCKKIADTKNIRRFLLYPGDHSLPITFWVRKNHLFHLSVLIQNVIERHAQKDTELHFYLARFGECCFDDENLLKKTDTASIVKLEEARTAVLNYRNGEGKTIIHIITVLELPDIEVFTIFTHLLRDIEACTPSTVRDINDIEESLFTPISQHNKNSRILTILTLFKSRKSLNIDGYTLICNMVSAFSSTKYHCFLEIELLLRVFIFLLCCNCESKDYRDRTVQMCKSLKYDHVVELLSIETVTKCQSEISSMIDRISDTFTLERSEKDITIPNIMDSLSPEMENSIRKCVQLLGDKSFRDICI